MFEAARPNSGRRAVSDGLLSNSVQDKIVARLSAVGWDFQSRSQSNGIDGLHPYPAKFIPEIPRSLLDILPLPRGTAVLDPFCGSGTTLAESCSRNVPSIGIDLNPIACLISRVRTRPLPRNLEGIAEKVLDRARTLKDVRIPAIPNLDHWFRKPVQAALASIETAIRSVDPKYADALRLCLSSIIVRVSNQESDTRYAAIQKEIARSDVFANFLAAVQRVAKALASQPQRRTSATVIHADTLRIGPGQIKKPIGLVITSPPYPNAYEYWLYHKYRMWWLGFDPLAVKEGEIGARAHFFKRNHHTAEDFGRQMQKTFQLIDAVTVPKAFVCFIVGRSKIHGKIADNAEAVEKVAATFGHQTIFRSERSILANRKSFNLSHANIKTESIIVLQKR